MHALAVKKHSLRLLRVWEPDCRHYIAYPFDDACKVAEEIGFVGKGGKGSHNSFSRTGERVASISRSAREGKSPHIKQDS